MEPKQDRNFKCIRRPRTAYLPKPPPPSPRTDSDEEEEEEPPANQWVQTKSLVKKEKRGIDIDLNIAPPLDYGGSAPLPAENDGNERGDFALTPSAASSRRVNLDELYDLNVREMNPDCDWRQKGTEAHLSGSGLYGYAGEADDRKGKGKETVPFSSHSEAEREKRSRRWEALLDVVEYELKNWRLEEKEIRNWKQKTPSGEVRLGGESQRGSTREKKITVDRCESRNKRLRSDGGGVATANAPPLTRTRIIEEVDLGGEFQNGSTTTKIKTETHRNVEKEYSGHGCEVAAAEAVGPVARSTRGRSVAMPNKYRDSVLDQTAVEEYLRRHGKSGKRKPR